MKNKIKDIEYELINVNGYKRHPKCLFKTLNATKNMRKSIVANNPKLKDMLFIYKTWEKDGLIWGKAID
jgi:hypothetical protein